MFRLHTTCRLVLALVVLTGLPLLGAGCGSEPQAPDPGDLRLSFPGHADAVLARGDGFVATEHGFAQGPHAPPGAWLRVEADLPHEGDGAIRLRVRDFEVRVREVGATGQGRLIEHAIAYQRANGTSYWTIGSGGVEEWLHLKASRGEVAASWEVEGGVLRQHGEQVAVVDPLGKARIWISAPVGYTPSGRQIQPRLRADGTTLHLSVDADGQDVLIDPAWTATAFLKFPVARHTATRLGDGNVLVAGGFSDVNGHFGNSQLYNPVMGTWSDVVDALTIARSQHTATLLTDGKVLLAGGNGVAGPVNLAELYDPSNTMDPWSDGASMGSGRSQHAATLLANGEVLVTGGSNLSTAEIYHVIGDWDADNMMTARTRHTSTLLPSSRVLVAGGYDSMITHSSAQLYDPYGMQTYWFDTGSMKNARSAHTATLLGNGMVLVTGGCGDLNCTPLRSTELYNPADGSWSLAADMLGTRARHTATLLPNGKVLVAGGNNETETEVYDPATNTWSVAGDLNTPRYDHTATLLGNGDVLLTGGINNGNVYLSDCEIYHPLANGEVCLGDGECASGVCVQGICCDKPCQGNPCMACLSGTCAPLTNAACDDANLCTGNDVCNVAGVCKGNTIDCTLPSACYQGTERCIGATGLCDFEKIPGCMPPGPTEGQEPPTPDPGVTLCNTKEDCPDGKPCVEGLCCNNDCAGECESCALPGTMGTCSPQHNTDVRDECWPGLDCRRTCIDGACGDIPEGMQGTQCAPPTCDDDGIHLLDEATCTSGSSGLQCNTTARVQFSCEPYRCIQALGACRTECNSIDDCAPTFVCDPQHRCVPPPAVKSGDDSGCAMIPGNTPANPHLLGISIAALVIACRRRRPVRQSLLSLFVVIFITLLMSGCSGEPEATVAASPTPASLDHTAESGFQQDVNPPANAWSPVFRLTPARYEHTATLLGNGKVLVAGGFDGSNYLDGAQLYDPYDMSGNPWSDAGLITVVRSRHTATILGNGNVLVTGGFDGGYLKDARHYDPISNMWTQPTELGTFRAKHTATLLGNGDVLVAGGVNAGPAFTSDLAEIYLATGVWVNTSLMTQARAGHTATLLPNGHVLIAGGYDDFLNTSFDTVEVYEWDMAGGSFSPEPNMANPRAFHTATLLGNGNVLITGGCTDATDPTTCANTALNTAELYNPYETMGSPWSATKTPMIQARAQHTATLLSNGMVLVVGGANAAGSLANAELYNPVSDTWVDAGNMNNARRAHTATLLYDGTVLVVGGDNGGALPSYELYTPSPNGSVCAFPGECQSGYCVDGVCCNSACQETCRACSLNAGAPSDGTCQEVFDDNPCFDGDLCTQGDRCQQGSCVAGSQVNCGVIDACHSPGACDSATGQCSYAEIPNCAFPEPPAGESPPTVPGNAVLCKVNANCPDDQPDCSDDCPQNRSHCVDGVCCNDACQGICMSCAVPGSIGTCTAQNQMDLRGDCLPAFDCNEVCVTDSTNGDPCGAVKPGTECAPPQCYPDGIHLLGPAVCEAGQGDTCSVDNRAAFNCSPYRCAEALGACFARCDSVDQCVSPYVCDPSHRCVPPPDVASGYDTGCAIAPRRVPGLAIGLVALLVAALAARRRRSTKSQRVRIYLQIS